MIRINKEKKDYKRMKTKKELLEMADGLFVNHVEYGFKFEDIFSGETYMDWIEEVRSYLHKNAVDKSQYDDFLYLKEHVEKDNNYKRIISIIKSTTEEK